VEHLLFPARIEFDLVNAKNWPEMKETVMSEKISTSLRKDDFQTVLRSHSILMFRNIMFSLDGMQIDAIRYEPYTLSLRPFKFFFQQLH